MGCQFCQPQQKGFHQEYPYRFSQQSTDEYVNYIRLLGQDYINSKLDTVHQEINKNYLKKQEHLIADDKIKDSNQKIQIWANFENKQNSFQKIQNIYTETSLLFTPEIYYMFSINENVTNPFGNAKFKILDYTINNDTAVLICHTKTNKQWFCDERNFIVMRIIKLLEDGSIIEFQQSIHLTKLKRCQNFQKFSKSLKNVGTIFASYIYYNNVSNEPKVYQYYKVDFLQSMSLKLAKNFIKRKIINYNIKLNTKIINFILTYREWYKLIWFTSSKQNFERIFSQNLIIIKNSELDLKKFNQKKLVEFNEIEQSDKFRQISSRRKNTDIESIKEEIQYEKEIFQIKPFGQVLLKKSHTEYHKLSQFFKFIKLKFFQILYQFVLHYFKQIFKYLLWINLDLRNLILNHYQAFIILYLYYVITFYQNQLSQSIFKIIISFHQLFPFLLCFTFYLNS